MKAEDTVMSGREIYEIEQDCHWEQGCRGVPIYIENLLKAQAEISFKAGYEQGKVDTELRTGLGQNKGVGL